MTTIYEGDCVDVMSLVMGENEVDLTVTSPPYDNLRKYNGYTWDFEAVAAGLLRVTKPGGVIVWIVADETTNGSESGSSFRQALHFMSLGFRLHDTMVWHKGGFSAAGTLAVRYGSVFEYMFVFSKGAPKTFNPIKDRPNKHAGTKMHGTVRNHGGVGFVPASNQGRVIADFGQRFNVWEMPPAKHVKDHPAPFPLALARDHILSWSNPGDTVFDPHLGSGTTGRAALATDRNFIGCDIDSTYVALAKQACGVLA